MKSNDAFKKTNMVIDNKSDIFDDLTFENVAEVAQMLMDKFVEGEFDKIEIVYNKFKNAASQAVTTEKLLPIEPAEDGDLSRD